MKIGKCIVGDRIGTFCTLAVHFPRVIGSIEYMIVCGAISTVVFMLEWIRCHEINQSAGSAGTLKLSMVE